MILGIDASNIRAGGGLTHIRELLAAADPPRYGFERVIVWSGRKTLDQLPDYAWLDKRHVSALDGNQIGRILWQRFALPSLAAESCSLLFVPGGNYHGGRIPFVSLSQNLLPFDQAERRRFGLSWTGFRLLLLKWGQSATFRKSAGMMFLTETARKVIEDEIGVISSPVAVIPHGITASFRQDPVSQKQPEEYSFEKPFRWLYVSLIDLYKHQWNVVEAVGLLRKEGLPIALDLVGPAHQRAMNRFYAAIEKWDPNKEYVTYHGSCAHFELPDYYRQSDGVIFASSCENMPIILLEGMLSGLPIACSNRGPMPEILKDGGLYFDPENPAMIATAIRELFLAPEKRAFCAKFAFKCAGEFTWQRCANETFGYLSEIALLQDRHINL